MGSIPNILTIDNGFKELLETVTGKPADFARAPLDSVTGETVEPPYTIIYPVPGGSFSGPIFHSPEADVDIYYQVRCVGLRYDQARAMADLVRQAVTGRADGAFDSPIDVDTMTVMDRHAKGSPGMIRREGKIFYADDDYCLRVTTS